MLLLYHNMGAELKLSQRMGLTSCTLQPQASSEGVPKSDGEAQGKSGRRVETQPWSWPSASVKVLN